MYRNYFFASAFCTLLFAASCNDVDYLAQETFPRPDGMDLLDVKVELPEGPGREYVKSSCITCHSLRYIEMQPALSEKAWEKTVTKMIKTYGASVRDSVAAKEIVHYLASIRKK